jgi:trk system potassium uptake protein TrkH
VGINTVTHGFFSNFSAALACISNIGPAFEAIGPYASYAEYSIVSKITLSLMMLIGRLEIFPVLILFSRRTWKRI